MYWSEFFCPPVRGVPHHCAARRTNPREDREAKRMLADIRRGHITGLVFSKLARLARNRRELDEMAEIFQGHDAGLVSNHRHIDTPLRNY
jgi:DNA invertase Pin-like site-specific DNA recombinase